MAQTLIEQPSMNRGVPQRPIPGQRHELVRAFGLPLPRLRQGHNPQSGLIERAERKGVSRRSISLRDPAGR